MVDLAALLEQDQVGDGVWLRRVLGQVWWWWTSAPGGVAALREQDQVGGGVWVKVCTRCSVVVVLGKCPMGAPCCSRTKRVLGWAAGLNGVG